MPVVCTLRGRPDPFVSAPNQTERVRKGAAPSRRLVLYAPPRLELALLEIRRERFLSRFEFKARTHESIPGSTLGCGMRAPTTFVTVVALILLLGGGCGGGTDEATTSPSVTSERYAGLTRDDAIRDGKSILDVLSDEGSTPDPTLVKRVSYYDCQIQRAGACPDKPLLRAWYLYWAHEPVRGCVYVSGRGVVVGPPCTWR